MRNFFTVVFVATMITSLLAETAKPQEPIAFTTDSMTIDEANQTTTLDGNAVVTRGLLTMKANKIVVYTRKNAAGAQEFDHMSGEGNIEAFSGDQTIKSDSLAYDANSEIAVFTGNVVVSKGKSIAHAQKAEMNAATGIYKLIGPVKGTISGTLP